MGDKILLQFVPSVQLLQKVPVYWGFLKEVSECSQLQRPSVLCYSLWRYETKWLPLLIEHPNEDLEPPLDIHWMWHAHLLSPKKYNKDCNLLFGTVPDRKSYSGIKLRMKAMNKTMEIWSNKYPRDPFYLQDMAEIPLCPNFKSRLSYDVVAAAERQLSFFYNVTMPHYMDDKFLEEAVKRYCMFISLKKANPDTFVVPMYDVDLVWHTHQLCHRSYVRDTHAFLGFILNHDDSTTDRSPGSDLSLSDIKTRKLWNQMYGQHIAQPGTMYRGDPPHGQLYGLSLEMEKIISGMQCTLVIHEVYVDHPKSGVRISCRISVFYENEASEQCIRKLPAMKAPVQYCSPGPEGICTLHINTKNESIINVHARRKKAGLRGLTGERVNLGYVNCSLKQNIDTLIDSRKVSFIKHLHEGALITVKGQVTDLCQADLRLRLSMVSAGNFQSAIMPEHVKQLWGPVPLPQLPPGVENKCMVATHKLLDESGDTVFTVRIVHSLPLKMSAVQVHYKDQMVTVSHLIGAEQLPTKEQVALARPCIILDHKLGERAMLIKNTKGDWGVIKAVWGGMKRGVPPSENDEMGTPGDPGYLQVEFTELTSGQYRKSVSTILGKDDSDSRSCTFSLNGVTVDLSQNTIDLPGKQQRFAENIALTFSALTLLILCQPRPDVCSKGKVPATKPKPVYRGGRRVETLDTHNYMLFLYVGWYVESPSNSWQYWYAQQQQTFGTYDTVEESTVAGQDSFCPLYPDGKVPQAVEDGVECGSDGLKDMGSGICGGCGGCQAGDPSDMNYYDLAAVGAGAACGGGACAGGCSGGCAGGCSGGCGGGCGAM